MNGFLKTFFAALLAILAFVFIVMFMTIVAVSSIATRETAEVPAKSVLVIDLGDHFSDVPPSDPWSEISNVGKESTPGLYELIRIIKHARYDPAIQGIYLKAGSNSNDFASSEELRKAIINFRSDGKFVYAYGDVIGEQAYLVALAADKIYCNPMGGLEWDGIAMQMPFIKTALEKLEIQPQIFYAGKFKSATEPLRETRMTDANRLQSIELLGDLYGNFLTTASASRKIDTATLHRYADSNAIAFPVDALKHGLVDGLKYDDEVKEEISKKLGNGAGEKINFISPAKYGEAVDYKQSGTDRITVIYAEGTIIDGSGETGQIGSETYRNYIRKARLDNRVKAVVLRVNSGGGSSLASEVIWREIAITRKVKPVIVSFGDVAASGGYYISCGADIIFAQPNTITGSIGVFSVIPNMQPFFNNKLGVSFDEVSTSPHSNMYTVTRPLSPVQRQFIQNQIDTIYHTFKTRVADGRKKSMEYVDSIAQGRVWSGSRAVSLGLVDRIGGLDEAIAAAAAKARIRSYRLNEYPAKQTLVEMFFSDKTETARVAAIKKELGEEGVQTYSLLRYAKQFIGKAQARMPFDISFR
ncbi:MAG TPA: signal peptide peptidase SppA [Flavitalea sp.]|nr:signal peptide peptidase SppA [Flavitalea sp.]